MTDEIKKPTELKSSLEERLDLLADLIIMRYLDAKKNGQLKLQEYNTSIYKNGKQE